jgi:hypothetical protein
MLSLFEGLSHPDIGETEKITSCSVNKLEPFKIFTQPGQNIISRHIKVIMKDSPKLDVVLPRITKVLQSYECVHGSDTGKKIPKTVVFSSKHLTAAIFDEAL